MARTMIILGVVCIGGAAWLAAAMAQPADSHTSATPSPAFPSAYVDAKGGISLPESYRLKWTHLGSYAVTEAGGEFGMHDVYAEPDAVADFLKTGAWRDGATIVKEVRGGREEKLTTGQARWDGEIKVWFVMVKDAKKSFPDNANWGRGWGWALFDKADPKKNTSTNYKLDCLACHVPAQDTDWIYTRGYPTLNEKDGPFKAYPKTTYEATASGKP